MVAHGAVDQFARVLASAGVDVRHLFSEFGVNRGEGGPFIPVPRGQVPPDTMTPEKLAALRAMVKVLPVSAPLESYRVTSPFGVREDPENERAGFHTGVDLAAPYDTPVYATAPGVVTFAGYRDDYGKIVEIDHGNGIATRYAHLHAFTVSVGQRVGLHNQIGYLGSSGRATGPHVHYEVVVNGEPQDPEKFIGLARYVQPMTTPVAVQELGLAVRGRRIATDYRARSAASQRKCGGVAGVLAAIDLHALSSTRCTYIRVSVNGIASIQSTMSTCLPRGSP